MQEAVEHIVGQVDLRVAYRCSRDIKGGVIVEANEYNDEVFISDTVQAPCVTCPHAARCQEHELACARFLRYTQCESDWPERDNTPSRDVYELVYTEEDDAPVGSYWRAAAARGDLARLDVVAGELAIKDNLAEYAYDLRREAVRKERLGSLAALNAKVERGRVAKAVIECEYSDSAIAERTGVLKSFVRLVRQKFAQYPGSTAQGAIHTVGVYRATGERAKIDR